MSASPRTLLVNRLTTAHGFNPRDWAEAALVRDQAVALVASLTDTQVDHALRHHLTIPASLQVEVLA